jgi:hypothetical protein
MGVTQRAQASTHWPRDPVERGTLHALPRPVLGGTVVFASTQSSHGAGLYLALNLLRELGRLDPRWCYPPDDNALTLLKSVLGSPCLLLWGKPGPSLSFSHGEGRLWAAMSGRGSVGIDVAYPEEFAGDYPFYRAFGPEELDCVRDVCRNDTARTAALIWSLKEASVKATGAGFNLFDPVHVRVGTPLFKEQGIMFQVQAGRPVSAWAREEGRGWLSVAWLSRDQEETGSMTTLSGGSPWDSLPTKRTACSPRSS